MYSDSTIIATHSCLQEEDTESLAQAFALQLVAGDLVFLEGDLGAGKTTFVRSVLRAFQWTGAVRSPSYGLVHSYSTKPSMNHLDLYRISNLEEAIGLDLDQIFSSSTISFVEWPDRLEKMFRPTWLVHFEIGIGTTRDISIHRPAV